MKKYLWLLLFPLLGCTGGIQNESYNVKRAQEYLEADEKENAIQCLKKELSESPSSVQALDLLGYIYGLMDDYGMAISLLDKAVKYSSRKDSKSAASAYYHRAGIHALLGDTLKAIADYETSIRKNPEHRSAIIELGDLYFYCNQFDKSDNIFRKLQKLDGGDPYSYYGFGRNLYTQGDYEKARVEILKGERLDTDKERSNTMNMRVELLSENYGKALAYALSVLEENESNSEAYHTVIEISDSVFQTTVNQIYRQQYEYPENEFWQLLLAFVYMNHENYEKAVKCFLPIAEGNGEYNFSALYSIGLCYDKLGDLQSVIRVMDMALSFDSTDADCYNLRADAKFYKQDLIGAESDYRKMMDYEKASGYYCYYRLGWIKEMQGKYEEALDCYNKSIALDEEYAYSYMMKGNVLKLYLNREEEAEEAFKSCIRYDVGIGEGTCKQYAYLLSGNIDKAIAVNDSILEKFPTPGSYYDAACLYSRMGRLEESLAYLEIAFEKGYKHLEHLRNDDDMDNVRKLPEYRALIRRYESEVKEKHSHVMAIHSQPAQSYAGIMEIPIIPDGQGHYYVRCHLNNLAMDFLLDTGCSDVSISSVESKFMLKNGYLSKSDLLSEVSYTNATGEVRKAQGMNIQEVRIGTCRMQNVKASIVPNQAAPLLLGQNVLRKFGKIEIDYQRNLLRIHPYER